MAESRQSRVPVLLDTDIGSDIDDALCLAYLLQQPRCELLGVTTVSPDPIKRAMLVDAICRRAGRADIPIYPGAASAILGSHKQLEVPQAAVLDRWAHSKDFPKGEAVRFMRDTIESRPGEVTLLAIGPMTNVGLLFATYPETVAKLKSLVLMCGGTNHYEWNAINDPIATAVVYQTKASPHISIGLDVTMRCVLDGTRARAEIGGVVLDPVADMSSVWLRRADRIVFHDPLAAAVVFEPDLCEYESGTLSVELKSDRLAGHTLFDRGNPSESPHTVAVSVDAERFFDHYFEVVKG